MNWSWPFTRAHERYHDLTVTTVTCLKHPWSVRLVTTVTCLKHPWSVRLYDTKNMRIVKAAEERKIVRQIQASFDQARPIDLHAVMAGL